MRNFFSVEQFTNEEVMHLLDRAIAFKTGKDIFKSNATIVNMFFENSTRTKHSFEMAEHKIGMQQFNFDVGSSSVAKGESLYDSVLTMQALGVDVAVIRHQDRNYMDQLVNLKIKIVNGGSGSGQHPSQSLLDIMTIYEEFGYFEGLKIAIIGDIIHSRVAMSNMTLLNQLGAHVIFAGPMDYFDTNFEQYGTWMTVDDAVKEADVVMMLRVQLERHDTEEQEQFSKNAYHERSGLTRKRYRTMKDHAIIMHPAPVNRDVELASQLVECKKSRIVEQMSNGVYARIAILEWVLEGRYQ
ncbi:aspartate carbamoyltransferase catalytic subunit [Jeotgalibaca sp. MA1X17-3]|uniref:aspartate carbamoyltransferase catalytic subunit n=1 Tax=Jeotgalibaca sp. MA1X17-3 TaxID=2908211 RepID=UPI001F294CE3|nr:aspartate carbamoyltransferase catalytic subunit [Jeotgalibaca sp. MA1X17-3]UJF15738.1 aspartate carbamoyltransferase catalytic subunit [Jeotgalibaca sp. MA1X17-3]